MFHLKESTHIHAPIDRCFLLSTSIALVEQTIGLKPVEGKTSGLIEMGDRLVWLGWKFGLVHWDDGSESMWWCRTY